MFKKSFDNKTPLLVAFVADIRKNIYIKFNPVLFNFQLPLSLLRTTAPEQKSRELWELSSKIYLDSYLIYLVFMFNFWVTELVNSQHYLGLGILESNSNWSHYKKSPTEKSRYKVESLKVS